MNIGKEWLVRVGFTLAALTAGPPIVHFENTQRVVGALLGEDVSCGDGTVPNDPRFPYDAIVVLGAGRLETTDGSELPDYGKRRLEAAANAYVDGFAPIVILLNGAGRPEEDIFTEERYFRREVQMLTEDDTNIPDEAILMDNQSINTATNMAELERMANEHGLRKVVIVTNDFHLPRAILFACAYGVNASGLPAEGVIAGKYPERADELAGLHDTKQMQEIRVKETAEVFLIAWDPKGYIPTWLKVFLDS